MVIGSSTDKVYMVMEHMDNDLKSCLEQLHQPLPISEVYIQYIIYTLYILATM